jgi:ribosomal protein L28
MAYRCDVCDKKTEAGRNNRHHKGVAGKRWLHRAQRTLRQFKPNLHWITLPLQGTPTRMRACAKCIKRVKFDNKKAAEIKASSVSLA